MQSLIILPFFIVSNITIIITFITSQTRFKTISHDVQRRYQASPSTVTQLVVFPIDDWPPVTTSSQLLDLSREHDQTKNWHTNEFKYKQATTMMVMMNKNKIKEKKRIMKCVKWGTSTAAAAYVVPQKHMRSFTFNWTNCLLLLRFSFLFWVKSIQVKLWLKLDTQQLLSLDRVECHVKFTLTNVQCNVNSRRCAVACAVSKESQMQIIIKLSCVTISFTHWTTALTMDDGSIQRKDKQIPGKRVMLIECV